VLANSAGSAPGLRVELPGGVVYALPGVPFEMHTIMDETVLPELARIAGLPAVARRTLRTARLWESVVATRLAEVEAMDGVRLAYLPDPAEVKIRITVAGPDAARRLADVEARVRALLGTAVYGAEDETLDRVVHRLLAERGATVAAAESLTGGLIGAELTAMPGSSATFAGGMVTYATETKHRLLGVPAELLAEHGAVHPDVAAAMAAGRPRRARRDLRGRGDRCRGPRAAGRPSGGNGLYRRGRTRRFANCGQSETPRARPRPGDPRGAPADDRRARP
jgi:nicotinamide-nucleotide amidase